MQEALNVGLIYGSTRTGRMCDTVAAWVKRRLATWEGVEIEIFDPLDSEVMFGTSPEAEQTFRQRLERCDAFIVITPEYNHSYPAPLKALIDKARFEWAAKPVAFVSYGGISGGLRAVEHLRNVFTELHATSIRSGVSFANAFQAFDNQGEPLDTVNPKRRLEFMLQQLEWWAIALKQARKARDYREVAA